VGENIRTIIRGLSSIHAPLGRWTPFAASVLFAASGLSHSIFLRIIAYIGALVLALLIAADVAGPFVDPHSFPDRPAARTLLTLPMLFVRLALTGVLGSIYTFLVFIGIGLWAPFILLPFLFAICSLIAWRNVDLWYEQGAVFEQELKETERSQGHSNFSASGHGMP